MFSLAKVFKLSLEGKNKNAKKYYEIPEEIFYSFINQKTYLKFKRKKKIIKVKGNEKGNEKGSEKESEKEQ